MSKSFNTTMKMFFRKLDNRKFVSTKHSLSKYETINLFDQKLKLW
jgi:hypothetical protein